MVHKIRVIRMDGSLAFNFEDFVFDTLFAEVLSWEEKQIIPVGNENTRKPDIRFHEHFEDGFSWRFTRHRCEPEPALYAYHFEEGDYLYIIARDNGRADGACFTSTIKNSYTLSYIAGQMGLRGSGYFAGLSPQHHDAYIESLFREAKKRLRENPQGPLWFRSVASEAVLR